MNIQVTNSENAENTTPPMKNSMKNILSPRSGNIHNVNNIHDNDSSKEKDQIFQLQIEIQSLKNRLNLSSSANKNDLLELLSEKDHVLQTKTKQIQTLNEKFHKITMAVAQMEREVKVLRKDNQEMESDNKKLKRHLNIREKEVTVLVSRCAAQEDKLAEGKESRIMEKQVKDLEKKLLHSKHQLQQLEGIQQTLQKSEAERDAAMTKIDKLTVEQENLKSHLLDSKAHFEVQLEKRDSAVAALEKDLEKCRKLKEERDVENYNLNTNLTELRKKTNEMHQSMQDWKMDHKSKLQHLQKEKEVLSQDLNRVHEEKKELRQAGEETTRLLESQVKIKADELERKQQEIQEFQKVIGQLKNDHSISAEEASGLKEKIRSLEGQISNFNAKETQMLEAERSNAETIRGLQRDMRGMQKASTEMKESYEAKIASLLKENAAMKQEYEGMLLESEEQFKEQDAHYETERLKVQKLQNEIDQINAHSVRQEDLRKREIRILEESVKSAKEKLEAQEKYAASKEAELKIERENVARLEANVQLLEDCSRQSELDAAAIVDDLNMKVDKGIALQARLEEERDRIVAESEETMDKLLDKISSLESEFLNLKAEIVSKDAQLELRQVTIDTLGTAKEDLEKKILSYRGDLETLMTAYDETKEEYSKKAKDMKVEMEKNAKKFKMDYSELQTIATESQEELEKLASSNDSLQETINERNKTIDDLITCSKTIEQEKMKAESMLADVQERWQNHLKENEELKRRSNQMRIEKEKEINRHIDALDATQSEKENLELKVKQLEAKVQDMKKKVEETAELKAENYLLKDKIDRQEAFLKRKLHKEKVMKERMIPANPSHPALKSPPRISSNRNSTGRIRSATRKSLDSPQQRQLPKQRSSSSIPVFDLKPRPNIEELELKRSASDELDDLLNDDGVV